MRLLSITRLAALGCACVAATAAHMPVRAASAATPALAAGAPAAGTTISNSVSATYGDGAGNSYSTVSNTVTVTVAAVGSVTVGPKEQGCANPGDDFGIGQTFVRTFTITNTSNQSDAFTVQTATTSAGAIQGIAFVDASNNSTPVTLGSTTTPTLAPGASIQVQITVGNTAGIAAGTDVIVGVTVRSTVTGTASGLVTDSGTACAIAVPGAALSSPAGPGLVIQKLVNGTKTFAASGGATVTYSITFEDFGGVAAQNVVVTDPVPAGLTPNLSSVAVDGTTTGVRDSLSGQTLVIDVGTVQPNVVQTISFTATIDANASTGATYVNTASVGADNVTRTNTTPATVIIGTANVVYDGYVGSSAPIGNATVTIVNATSGAPLAIGSAGQSPNAVNANPFVTGADGTYSFDLPPGDLSGTYDITISAPGYLNRKIQITLVPDPSGTLYTVTLTALDGLPLAVPGGFTTTTGPVTIANIYGLFGNLPMFETHPVTIVKTDDRGFASAGDRIIFTLQYADGSAATLGATTVTDTLPAGLVYAPGTGRVDGVHVEPVVSGRTLTWSFPSLSGSHTIVYATVILPGTEAGATLQNNVTIRAGIPNSPGAFATASADATVQVTSGVFDSRTIITGRVYLDVKNTGHVAKGDIWLPNVRVYLEDGESAVTDVNGRYSFPGVRPGMHVARLDPTTLPPGVYPFDEHSYDSERSTRRLIHHIYDSGLIEDINFALAGSLQP